MAPFLALRKTSSFLCPYAEIKVRPHGGNLWGLSAEWLVCRRAVYLSGPCTVKASFFSIELRNPTDGPVSDSSKVSLAGGLVNR